MADTDSTHTEVWKPVPGYEDLYQVSSEGRARSLRSGQLIGSNRRGYIVVSLSRDGVGRMRLLHRLVLLAFVGPCPDGLEGAHLNGNSLDNRLSNLQWVTHTANERHKIQHGTSFFRNRHPTAKLTREDVGELRRLRADEGLTFAQLGMVFGITPVQAYGVAVGKYWPHVEEFKLAPPRKVRPKLEDLDKPGPPLSPADFAGIIGLRREVVGEMCRLGEIQCFHVGAGSRSRRWKIARKVALDYCIKIGMRAAA